jgi:TorA maturation chaperone TorD
MTPEVMRKLVQNREDTYGFLAGIFRAELNAEQIKEMIDKKMLDLMIDPGCKVDLSFIRDKPVEQAEEDLACEYAALFVGPGEHIAPYESTFVPDSTGRVGYYWGECTLDMKNWVEQYGLRISESFGSIPDHISIELELMQRIIEQEKLAWQRDDSDTAARCVEVEKTFFNQHLVKWIPAFCDRVVEAARLDFYREIARLTRDFIQSEAQLLDVKVSN